MTQGQDLSERVAVLEAMLAEQAALIEQLLATTRVGVVANEPVTVPVTEPVTVTEPAPSDVGRRHLLGGAALVAAGAAAGGVAAALGSASRASAATTTFADTGGSVALFGQSTSASSTNSGVGVAGTATGTPGSLVIGASVPPIGVAGAGPIGVKAFGVASTADVMGVVGDGGTGRGGVFSGSRADLQVGGGSGAAGPSRSNTAGGHTVGELAMQSNGDLWVAVATTANGVAGSWKRAAYREGGAFEAVAGAPAVQATSAITGQAAVSATTAVAADGQIAVHGVASSNGGAGVRGDNSGAAISSAFTAGVLGTSNGGGSSGVVGQGRGGGGTGVLGTGTSIGVRGRADGSAPTAQPPAAAPAGVLAEGIGLAGSTAILGLSAISTASVAVEATGAAADLRLVGGAPGPSRLHDRGHTVGEIAMETTGTLWVCVTAGGAGQPGVWKRVAYVDDVGAAFHALASPGRVYDSRTSDGKLSGGETRTISVAKVALTGVEIVPPGATAVTFTITLDQTVGQGFCSIYPSNVGFPGTSNVNWFGPGQIVATGGTVTVAPDRTVTVQAGGGATHVIVDVNGYFA